MQSSVPNTLSALISTYHLTPTFAPLHSAQLDSYITPILAPAPSLAYSSRPRPSTIHDLVTAHSVLDSERVKFNQPHTALLDLQLDLQGNRYDSGIPSMRTTPPTTADSPLLAFKEGSEPPLRSRVRRVVDKLHGTANGGLAGLQTVLENTAKAQEWSKGLQQAKLSKEQREREEEDELKGFSEAWEEDGSSRDESRL